jgi:hypothetical protein
VAARMIDFLCITNSFYNLSGSYITPALRRETPQWATTSVNPARRETKL